MSAAQNMLMRLLKRAEKARLRAANKPVSFSMSSKRDAPEYHAQRTWPEREAFHAQMALAERAGAITLQRARYRGEGQDIERIIVADLAALATYLGVKLQQTRVSEAEAVLAPWRARFPVLEDVLAAWQAGRRVRGHTAEAARAIADAALVVDACQQDLMRERSLRRESARLFAGQANASKRIEQLTSWLDLISSGHLKADGTLEDVHVWAALGLRKEPLPLLLAGNAQLHLEHGQLSLLRPWLGVPPEALQAVQTSARCVLSIENLASFHDAARLSDTDTLLLYTGGMPSPAWRRAYACILRSLPVDARIYHWGDIDQGGFRIASVLAHSTAETGHRLLPWQMSPANLPASIRTRAKRADPATLKAMCHWAERTGWPQIAHDLQQQPLMLEQELLEARLPASCEPLSSG